MGQHMLPGACESFNTMMSVTDCHNDPLSSKSQVIGVPIQENPDLVAEANSITYMDAQTPPFLIAHSTEDQLVPHHQSNMLFEAMAEARVPAVPSSEPIRCPGGLPTPFLISPAAVPGSPMKATCSDRKFRLVTASGQHPQG